MSRASKAIKLGHDEATPQFVKYETVQGPGGGASRRYGQTEDGKWVQLTAAGLPRKKPGRKPGALVKAKNADGTDAQDEGQPAKVRKPRKPRDPNAPPIQRKRKIASAGPDAGTESEGPSYKQFAQDHSNASFHQSSAQNSPAMSINRTLASNGHHDQSSFHQSSSQHNSPSIMSREISKPGSMHSILNAEPSAQGQSPASANGPIPVRGLNYDPIRNNAYDPIRESMKSNSPFPSKMDSPRLQAQPTNRSPSIASLIEPQAAPTKSPNHGYQPLAAKPLAQDSVPPSPSARPTSTPSLSLRQDAQEVTKSEPPPAPAQRPVIKESNFTTIANGPIKKTLPSQKAKTNGSTPKTDTLDDVPQDTEGRSILDFGRVKPGDEAEAPAVVLTIPITAGETNKYVNFMRLAEERFGWDALHPRLAANRDRKARIAAATASLANVESGRESGDEMSVDLSDAEGSNQENGVASGVDGQAKPKKKRNFKEDQYDIDDDFVDDSEMLWEAQAAASRDGFFVYSGPLVPEVEKPDVYVFLALFALEKHANKKTVLTVLPSVVVVGVVEAVAVGAARREVAPVLAAVAVLVLAEVRSHESLVSPSLKRLSASGKRPNARAWRKTTLPRILSQYLLSTSKASRNDPNRGIRVVDGDFLSCCSCLAVQLPAYSSHSDDFFTCQTWFGVRGSRGLCTMAR